jgi:hypothetical protein
MARGSARRLLAAINRTKAAIARRDTRAWVVTRRERTRQLIERGGLIAKAGLIELTDDDRAVLFGLLIEAASKLRTDNREPQLVLWRRRGQRAFRDGIEHDVSTAPFREAAT